MTTPFEQTLNLEQEAAIAAAADWLRPDNSEPFFVLSGPAGTGKTYCIRALIDRLKGIRVIFTAPTNKATKVLRDSLTTPEYKPECCTIYSLLGLRLEPSGEVRELKASDNEIDIGRYRLVAVDEGSMLNEQVFSYISRAAVDFGCKFLIMGDSYQLPPVKETRSPIWALPNGAELTQVMRHDNQILKLATAIRGQIGRLVPRISFASDNDGDQEGVWKASGTGFMQLALIDAQLGHFSQPNASKMIAWRNVTVDRYNKLLRNVIFDEPTLPWLIGDRVLFAAPAKNLDEEPMASTDDEGIITRVDEDYHPLQGDVKCWRIAITLDDNRPVVAWGLHPDGLATYNQRIDQLAADARANSKRWKQFWEYKEVFHQLKYAYAITAHRSQGSTYDTAFVDWQDILLNQNRQEAFRCLYVACTRPRRALVLP